MSNKTAKVPPTPNPNLVIKSVPIGRAMKGTIVKSASSMWQGIYFRSESGELFNLRLAQHTFKVVPRNEELQGLEAGEIKALKTLGFLTTAEIKEAKERAVKTRKLREFKQNKNIILDAAKALGIPAAKIEALLPNKP